MKNTGKGRYRKSIDIEDIGISGFFFSKPIFSEIKRLPMALKYNKKIFKKINIFSQNIDVNFTVNLRFYICNKSNLTYRVIEHRKNVVSAQHKKKKYNFTGLKI